MTTTENTTTSTSIQEAVQATLRSAGYGSYIAHAGPVIAALQEREQGISERLLAYATEAGADEEEVREFLVSTGLSVKEPEVEDDEDDEDDDEDLSTDDNARFEAILGRIDATLGKLTEFARGHGYRG